MQCMHGSMGRCQNAGVYNGIYTYGTVRTGVVQISERERELRPSRPPLHHMPQVTRVGAHLNYPLLAPKYTRSLRVYIAEATTPQAGAATEPGGSSHWRRH